MRLKPLAYSGVTNRAFKQEWDLTPTGNWLEFKVDSDGDTNPSRNTATPRD